MAAAAGAMDVFAMFDDPGSAFDVITPPFLHVRSDGLKDSWRDHAARHSSLVQAEPRARAQEERLLLFVARVDAEPLELVKKWPGLRFRIVRQLPELGRLKDAAQLILDVLCGASQSCVAEARRGLAEALKAIAPKRDVLPRARI